MRSRNLSIRSKIIALVVVPLSALIALWVFATLLTVGPALNLLSAQTLLDTVGNPAEVLVGELQRERRESVVYLSDEKSTTAALSAQRAATDRAAAEFRKAAGSDDAQSAASATLQSRISQTFTDLDALAGTRSFIDAREVDPVGALGFFNSVVDTGFQMFAATATFGDETIDRQIRALSAIGRGQEYLSRIDALLAGADAGGKLTADARRELLTAIGTSQFLLTGGVGDLPAAERTAFQVFNNGTAFARVRQMETALLTSARADAAPPVTADQWQPAYDQSAQQLRAFEVNAAAALAERATPIAVRVLIRLGAAALLGLLAVIISVIVSIRVGRSIVGRLRRLRLEALEMAGERLPTVVRRLQRGEPVDVEVETPPLEYGRDEIGQVGRAFNEVQRTAVQSAVEEASVRRGINEVFLNIARRSQTLLHRQLALLDRMERRETEPQELEDLYRVDHLATRMRRHAEDLVILAGAAPGRGWRNPVPVIDVVRGAISEVEDYQRVDIRSIETASVLGRAVGDVIHLLAELLENAASFSPPQTRVLVAGQVLPNGYAIEIEDRGLGMSAEAISDANRRLGEPPDFDPADSARLGLFVVAQLAARHGIRVSLRPSAYGGVTAIVLVPGDLVTPGGGPMALPAGPTPADKSWDRPLVGTGEDDPSRHSLAALQWQGTEELRSITVARRPIALNGSAQHTAGPVAPPIAPDTQELPLAGGPSPSAVVDGLSPDGLVQRRRKTRPEPTPAPAPETFPTGLDSPARLLHQAEAASAPVSAAPVSAAPVSGAPVSGDMVVGRESARGSVVGRETAGGSVAERETVGDRVAERESAGGRVAEHRTAEGRVAERETAGDGFVEREAAEGGVAEGGLAVGETAAGERGADELVTREHAVVVREPAPQAQAPVDEPLLPKRVRQASLAPQLRAPVVAEAAAAARSPEQVRSIMSALQWGTKRGRLAAAGLAATGTPPQPGEAPTMAEAATVIFPAVRDHDGPRGNQEADRAPQPETIDAAAGDAANGEQPNRPEKDA